MWLSATRTLDESNLHTLVLRFGARWLHHHRSLLNAKSLPVASSCVNAGPPVEAKTGCKQEPFLELIGGYVFFRIPADKMASIGSSSWS